MFSLADPQRITEILTTAGWAPPTIDALTLDLDIAAGRGLEEALVQVSKIGVINGWLRDQPTEIVAAALNSVREALTPYVDGPSVRLPGSIWLVSSAPA